MDNSQTDLSETNDVSQQASSATSSSANKYRTKGGVSNRPLAKEESGDSKSTDKTGYSEDPDKQNKQAKLSTKGRRWLVLLLLLLLTFLCYWFLCVIMGRCVPPPVPQSTITPTVAITQNTAIPQATATYTPIPTVTTQGPAIITSTVTPIIPTAVPITPSPIPPVIKAAADYCLAQGVAISGSISGGTANNGLVQVRLLNSAKAILGESNVDAAGQWVIKPRALLPAGQYQLKTMVLDASGKVLSEGTPVDTVIYPSASVSLTPNSVITGGQEITGTALAGFVVQISEPNQVSATLTTDINGIWRWTVPYTLNIASHTFAINQIDIASGKTICGSITLPVTGQNN